MLFTAQQNQRTDKLTRQISLNFSLTIWSVLTFQANLSFFRFEGIITKTDLCEHYDCNLQTDCNLAHFNNVVT